ncbi:hypothetical protein BAE29_07795 [Acidithiobacillus caldus]|uniref:Uncharacterized protein n=1 Tax=Acidithiobacillus caldus TaxID=33059 RepID=A0A1E7YL87_9PROT|nr:hypothetical protein BAE27_10945 [Acidithiobacillus caldus]OFC36203.1 hypothetical protein BAE28_09340 [Acidithiobacillus caldus]OFC39331.1 hypothetical protein BAE29_07795 [Acidithiobacillus caldus]
MRGPYDTVAGLTNLKTKIYIVISDGKIFFIQSANLIKDLLPYQKHGPGNCREILDSCKPPEVTRR